MIDRFRRLDYKWVVAAVFMFGLFMDILDSTAVNVAIPRLQADFHAPLSTVEWTVTGYLLSLALFIPGAGFLSDRFGSKRIFMAAMVIFVAGSALCGLAGSIEQLIAFRFVQGIGGGMMTPVSTAILSREFPGEERAKASAIISIPWVLAPIMGPVLGGYLVTYASWRWIFYINLPVGVAGINLALKVLHEHVEPYAQGHFDVGGLLTGGSGVAMLLYALAQAATRGWTSVEVLAWGCAAIACLLLFCLIERRASPPILDLSLFRLPLFSLGTLVTGWANAAFTGFIFLLALFLQNLQGRSAIEAGLVQAPSALGSVISLLFAARLYARLGPRRLMVAGFGVGGLLLLPFGFMGATTAALPILVVLALRGLSTPFGFTASQTIVYGPLESAQQGPASSIYNTNRQIASSLGVALLATVQVSRFRSALAASLAEAHTATPTQAMLQRAHVSGFRDAFFVVGGMMAAAGVLALFVSDRKVAAAMRLRVRRVSVPTGSAAPAGEPSS